MSRVRIPEGVPIFPPLSFAATFAGVAHLVERSLAKAEVAGSSPVSRSSFYGGTCAAIKTAVFSKGIEAALKNNPVDCF